eukprot:4137264-Alexandrium_andersonii.AAC.2
MRSPQERSRTIWNSWRQPEMTGSFRRWPETVRNACKRSETKGHASTKGAVGNNGAQRTWRKHRHHIAPQLPRSSPRWVDHIRQSVCVVCRLARLCVRRFSGLATTKVSSRTTMIFT